MTTQEHIILLLSILIGLLVYGLFFTKKYLYNHIERLEEQLDNHKIETKKELQKIRFIENPICKIGDVYNKNIVVTKSNYFERIVSDNIHMYGNPILDMGYEYELLNLDTKETTNFRSNYLMQKFIKDNDLKITKIGK